MKATVMVFKNGSWRFSHWSEDERRECPLVLVQSPRLSHNEKDPDCYPFLKNYFPQAKILSIIYSGNSGEAASDMANAMFCRPFLFSKYRAQLYYQTGCSNGLQDQFHHLMHRLYRQDLQQVLLITPPGLRSEARNLVAIQDPKVKVWSLQTGSSQHPILVGLEELKLDDTLLAIGFYSGEVDATAEPLPSLLNLPMDLLQPAKAIA